MVKGCRRPAVRCDAMGARKVWTRSPHSGGIRVPPALQEEVRGRVQAHAHTHFAGRFRDIEVRFRGPLCYIDAYREPGPPTRALLEVLGETEEQHRERLRNTPIHLCRLRYFAYQVWSLAFFTYSNERYAPSVFTDGEWFGTPEDAFDLAARVYL